VLNAGLSIPKISVIIRVSFANSPEKLTQLIGRALRDYEGKQGAWFIDLQFGQGVYKRMQLYRKIKFKLFTTTWEKFKGQL
jgi:superfamily II DNA or RNA helicase